uniref:Ankyrin repeat and SOCS box containing 15 n=1 Tax=Scleropages formosus TaxID=113540 RepID=A0A8C9WLM4_SCLFO
FSRRFSPTDTHSDSRPFTRGSPPSGDVAALQKMIRLTAAFAETDTRGWLPLHRAAVQTNNSIVGLWLAGSCWLSLEERTLEGETALMLAVQAGLLGNVKVLLENGASPHNTNSRNESRANSLVFSNSAVRIRSYDIVSTLIMKGAFVEQVCLKKWTAMHEAARVGCDDIMMLLLRNGGRVTERDGHGVTPLGVAAENAHAEVLEILIYHGKGTDAFSVPNRKAPNGDSVLHDAAASGNPDCVDLLLQNGANANIENLSSQLPIHRAAYKGHYLALKILIPVTTKRAICRSGQSPIHCAADGGHAQCLALLIENGFDVNATLERYIFENYADKRRTALYFTVSNGDITCTELLLNAGAKPDRDPLHCLLVAVRAGRYEIVRLLLAKRADVNCYFTVVSDTVFPTALQYCLRDEVMMRLLLNGSYDAGRCFCCHHDNSFHTHCPSNDLRSQIVSCLKHLTGTVVRVLLDYVGHVSICSKLKLTLEKHKEWPEIADILGNPRSLKHLCRLVIRRQMSVKTLCDISTMESSPLPPRIKDYLLYKEYDLYGKKSMAMLRKQSD